MKAEDILPGAASHAEFAGMRIRKGSVAAFLANTRSWLDAREGEEARRQAEAALKELIPAMQALGLFELLEVRDHALRGLVERELS